MRLRITIGLVAVLAAAFPAAADQFDFEFTGTITQATPFAVPPPWNTVAVGMPYTVNYHIDTDAPDANGDSRFGEYAITNYRIRVGAVDFAPAGPMRVSVRDFPSQDSYSALADMTQQFPGYSPALANVGLIDDTHLAFTSDAQPTTLDLGAFPTSKLFTVSFDHTCAFGHILGPVTGFTRTVVPTRLLSPPTDTYVTTATPTLEWSDAEDATYTVELDRSASFAAPIFSQGGLTAHTFTVPAGALSEQGEYFWRVLVTTAEGTVPAVGSPWNFAAVFPTCAADFDGNGVRAVSDIFAFLSAWFAGCP